MSHNGRNAKWESGIVVEYTTSQRMEMVAVCEGLESIPPSEQVSVISDSSYVINPWRKGWLREWRANGWIKLSNGKPVKNIDLWERMIAAVGRHEKVQWIKVKGHTESKSWEARGNDRVDRMAYAQAQRARLLNPK